MARPKKAITKAQIKAELERRHAFKPKSKSEHYLASNQDYIAHQLDDDLIEAHRKGKTGIGEEVFFGLMDPNLDAKQGTYYLEWGETTVKALWESILYRSLGQLRYADVTLPKFEEELEWIASSHFDDICKFLGLEPNEIRIKIPSILEFYSKTTIKGSYSEKIVQAFNFLKASNYSVTDNSLSESYAGLSGENFIPVKEN